MGVEWKEWWSRRVARRQAQGFECSGEKESAMNSDSVATISSTVTFGPACQRAHTHTHQHTHTHTRGEVVYELDEKLLGGVCVRAPRESRAVRVVRAAIAKWRRPGEEGRARGEGKRGGRGGEEGGEGDVEGGGEADVGDEASRGGLLPAQLHPHLPRQQ
eukprot:346282-Rhodomonas_salina.2